MAKTTSQIVARNKEKRAEEAKTAEARGDSGARKSIAGKTYGSGGRGGRKSGAVSGGSQEKQTFKERQMEKWDAPDVAPKKKEPEFRMPGAGAKTGYTPEGAMAKNLREMDSVYVKASRAGRDYDKYVNSPEYKAKLAQAKEQRNQNLTNEAPVADRIRNVSAGSIEDDTEKELRAKRDYWQNQKDQEQIRRITERNIKAYEDMPEEDRYAMDVLTGEHTSDGTFPVVKPYGREEQLTERQAVELENGLRRKYGKQRIKEIAESLEWERSRKTAEATQAEAERLGQEHPVVGSIAALGANIFGGVPETIGYGVEALTRTGQYPTLNPYNEMGDLRRYGSGIVTEVAGNIEGEDPNALRKLGSYAYQGGMEAARSAAGAALLGPAGSAALSAANTFGSTISEASEKGASPGRAALYAGTLTSIEYATEKMDMDRLFDIFGSGNPATIKGWLKNTAKQMGTEIAEEEVSLFAGELAESAILGDKAGRQQKIGEKIAHGMSYEDAVNQVNHELLNEALNTLAVTSFSAGMSATGASALNAVNNRAQGKQEVASVQDAAENPAAPMSAMDITDVFGDARKEGDGLPPGADAPSPLTSAGGEGAKDITDVLGKTGADTGFDTEGFLNDMGRELAEKAGPLEYPKLPEDVQRFVDVTVPPTAENVETAKAGQEIEGTGLELEKDFQDYPYNKQTVIKGYEESVDPKVLDFVKEVQSGKAWKGKKVEVGQVSDRMAEDIKRLTGVDGKSGNSVFLNTNGVDHIEKRHGANGEHDSTMADPADIARINYVLSNYDVADTNKRRSNEFKNKDGSPGKMVVFKKKINGTYFVVEAVPDTDKTWIVSAYMDKNEASKVPDAEAPSRNVQAEPSSAPEMPQVPDAQRNARSPKGDVQNELTPISMDTVADGGADVNGEFGGEGQKMSRLYENTFRNATDENIRDMGSEVLENRPENAMYTPQTEKGQNAEADARIAADGANQVYRSLMEKEAWTAADNKAAYKVMDELRKSGDSEAFYELSKKQREINTAAGQVVQSNAEYTRNTPMGAAESACAYLDELGEKGVDKRFWKKEGFENWSKSVRETVVDVSNKIDQVQDGDTASMRAIVEELARFRHTTAWLGYTDKLTWGARRALNNMDYQTMREVAIKQMSMIPGDFRKRSKAEVANTIRIQNMLASFKTINRNLQGNAIQGLMDSLSDSGGGRLADVVLSKFTGVRTTGNDVVQMKEASTAARKAWEFSTLCLELDIPTESASAYDFGAKSRTGGGSTNTFSMQGGPVERFMAGFTQYMKYALDATDSVFSEGSKGSTIASLEKLGAKSGLTDAEIEMIGDYNGERRTYKEERKLTKMAGDLKNAANDIQVGGVGLGDMVMPFVGVPSNVTQTAIDYSGLGIVEGITEMVQVAKDAKSMGTMTEEQRNAIILQQRKAAADFGRGMTGASLLALGIVASKFGCVKYTTAKDKDEENAQLNRHMEGFQINWSAITRVMQGESGDWQEGDIVSGLDSQSQFASLFSMADIWASDEGSWIQKSQDSAMAMYSNILEMPAMQGMKDLTEMIESLGDAMDGDSDDRATAMGTMLGDMASGAYPAFVRNAAQAMDPVIRDTSDTDPMQAAVNRVKAAIPGLSKTLPEKIDPLTGQPQMRDDSAGEAVWNRMFAPDAWHRIKENETAEYLDKLAEETGKTDFYPKGNAPASFQYGGEKITIEGKEDTEAYQQVYAENVSKSYGDMVKDPQFQALSPEEQMEKLKEAEKTAAKQAQAAIIGYKEMGEAARNEMLRLHKESGDDSVLYVPPDRKVTYTDKQGNEVKREMTGEEYKTYSETERKVYDETLDGLTRLGNLGGGYTTLSQKEQLEAAKYARQYASEMAKRKTFGDRYYEDEFKYISKTGNPITAAKDIVEKVRADTLNKAMDDVFQGAKKGFDTMEEKGTLAGEYERFRKLPAATQKEILGDADGSGQKLYMQGRSEGMIHYAAVSAGTAMATVKGTGKNGTIRDADRYMALANMKGTDKERKQAVMAWLDDGTTAEKRFDYMTGDLKMDIMQFAEMQGVYTEEKSIGGEGMSKRIEKIYMEEYGYSANEAKLLRQMFDGTKKHWDKDK